MPYLDGWSWELRDGQGRYLESGWAFGLRGAKRAARKALKSIRDEAERASLAFEEWL